MSGSVDLRPQALRRIAWGNCVICAGGPSFSAEQAAQIAQAQPDWRVCVVNDSWRRVPTADVLYAHDQKWWRHHISDVRAGFAGECWTQARPAAETWGLRWVDHRNRPGLTKTDATIHGGGNSGYGAINLAYLFGAQRIVLVGFDMRRSEDGAQHWFGEHPTPELRRDCPFAHWLSRFTDLARDLAAAGVHVVNCSPGSALHAFERAELADTLAT